MKRAALGAVLALLSAIALGLLAAAPAAAHADLLSSTPEDGSVLPAAPDEVVLTFSEDLLPDTVVVSVEDETGFVVRVLSFSVEGPDVVVTWPPGVPGREVGLNYRVVSQDGHPISGTIRYTLEVAAAGAAPSAAPSAVPSAGPSAGPSAEPAVVPTATEPPTDSSSLAPMAAIAAGLGVGIAVGAVIVLRRRRASS